jgi:hypothetical protein
MCLAQVLATSQHHLFLDIDSYSKIVMESYKPQDSFKNLEKEG